MSDEKALRTQEEINQEYSLYAMQMGDAYFKIKMAKRTIIELKRKMLVLNQEKAEPVLPKETS